MKNANKSKHLKDFLFEGEIAKAGDKIGNAALLLAMMMVTGAILFLIIAFANHEY